MGLGALMNGVTSGLNTGMNIKNSKKYLDIYQQYADQSALEHKQRQEDRDKTANPVDVLSGLADIADGGDKPLSFRTDGSSAPMNAVPAQESIALRPMTERPNYGMGIIKGYAQGGLATLDDGVFSGGVPPSSAGLSAIAAPQQPQPQQAQPAPEENLTPQQRITKAMMTTDLLSNPDKLSKMQAFAEMHGMGKAITPWLERAYTAKKSGMIDGAMQLMRGQVDDAIDSLERGGIKLADRPEPADPNNPRLWKINIEGAGEKVMDIGNLLQTTLDPKEFLKHDLASNESQGKRNVSDSQVRANDARVRVSNAQVGKLGQETKKIRAGLGKDGDITKLPSQAALAEWMVKNGVAKSKPEAWDKVKTLGDKSPDAQRQELIKARMQGGLMSLSDAAKEVDDFLGQATPSPAPSGAVRKFNPKTGGFD
jgi:hypothetical protein